MEQCREDPLSRRTTGATSAPPSRSATAAPRPSRSRRFTPPSSRSYSSPISHAPPAARRTRWVLGSVSSAAPPAEEERHIVSVVFLDLVGFTGQAEQLDPEDVAQYSPPTTTRCAR